MFVTASKPVRSSVVQVPGSKSYTHRVVIAAALADGKSVIRNALRSEDTQLTMDALKHMGVSINETPSGIEIEGCNGHFRPTEDEIFLGNSGTSMRLLCGLLAGQAFDVELVGDRSLMSRPMRREDVYQWTTRRSY